MLHVMESLESVGVTRRRITREEYLRMAEVGSRTSRSSRAARSTPTPAGACW